MPSSIYYLVSVSGSTPEDYEEYIMAISFEKHILEAMCIKYNQEPSCNLVIRENLKIFQIWLGYDKEKLCDIYKLMSVDYPRKKYNTKNLYAFNRIKKINNGLDFVIKNSIVDLNGFKDKVNDIEFFKDNNISLNQILFDTYYDEGIMNA